MQPARPRRPLPLAAGLAVVAALALTPSVVAQETRPATRPTPDAREFRPPGRTYRMPGADMGQLPLGTWANATTAKDFGVDLAKRLMPNDAGAAWIGAFTMLLVGLSLRPFRVGRALDALLLLSLAPFYVHLIDRQATLDDVPATRPAYLISFAAIYGLTAAFWLRGLAGSRASRPDDDRPLLPTRALAAAALALVLLNVAIVVVRPPDDCGHYVNLGAQRMLERKSWPYGDARLRGGAAATYGPTLYVVDAALLSLRPDPTPNDPEVLPDPKWGYVKPPVWAAKGTALVFQLAALAALFVIGRRLRDVAAGWTLVALYAGSPYILGLGGEATWVTGLAYVSHVGPAAMLLLAFAALPRPFLCGVLLNLAVATGYFPAFVWPAWSAYFLTRGRSLRFQAGFFAAGAVVLGALWFGTHAEPGENPIKLFLDGTIAHQEDPDQYGSSTLSFFGAHPEAKRILRSPLFEGEALRMVTPVFLLAAGFSGLGFLLGRRRTPTQLAFLTASIVACVQLWKHHASGTYVEWYYPFALIGVFARPRSDLDPGDAEAAAPPAAHA